jgi:t-SNARE complex subunit (syntaxin)
MVRLIRTDEIKKELKNAEGWLEGDDSFFDVIEQVVQDRTKYVPRVLKGNSAKNRIRTGPGRIEDDLKQARQNRIKRYW